MLAVLPAVDPLHLRLQAVLAAEVQRVAQFERALRQFGVVVDAREIRGGDVVVEPSVLQPCIRVPAGCPGSIGEPGAIGAHGVAFDGGLGKRGISLGDVVEGAAAISGHQSDARGSAGGRAGEDVAAGLHQDVVAAASHQPCGGGAARAGVEHPHPDRAIGRRMVVGFGLTLVQRMHEHVPGCIAGVQVTADFRTDDRVGLRIGPGTRARVEFLAAQVPVAVRGRLSALEQQVFVGAGHDAVPQHESPWRGGVGVGDIDQEDAVAHRLHATAADGMHIHACRTAGKLDAFRVQPVRLRVGAAFVEHDVHAQYSAVRDIGARCRGVGPAIEGGGIAGNP